MEVPDSLFEECVSGVVEPPPVEFRLERLSSRVWTWREQMRTNSKHTRNLSPAIQEATSAITNVITHLYHVILAFCRGQITISIEQDIEDFEQFANVICSEGDAKLKLKGLDDQILLVFPEGALFLPGPTVDKLFRETGMIEKAHRLLDQDLKNDFLNALQTFASTSQRLWSDERKATLDTTLVSDRGHSMARQQQMKDRMQELDEVRTELFAQTRNTLCHDPRVPNSLTDKITMTMAIEQTGREKRGLKLEINRFPLQNRFHEQIGSYYGLDFEADASTVEVPASEPRLENF